MFWPLGSRSHLEEKNEEPESLEKKNEERSHLKNEPEPEKN